MLVSDPHRVLFAVNSSGRVCCLSCNNSSSGGDNNGDNNGHNSRWTELPYLGVDFKRVSAATPGASSGSSGAGAGSARLSGSGGRLWAIGGDHQVYVCAFGVEVPIRVKETTYENERWNPIEGFCKNLLPTDRPLFSNAEGTRPRNKGDVKLPTMAWHWDTDWYLDPNLSGKALPDKEAWTYAVDFPAEYGPKKGFTSCVRRRRWIRYRRYSAVESWSAVPALHKDATEEPFIDIAVGGHEIPNCDELVVWAVTAMGRVVVRQGVTDACPEGTGWIHVGTNNAEVSQISVSASGLVWAVTWNGKALVRLGVSGMDPAGTHWVELEAPSPLSHVAVGEQAVWAISRDRKVWFRNGIKAAAAVGGGSESMAKGTKWVEMVGEMLVMSVGPGDQVLGIEEEDRNVVFRTGVSSPSDLSGKTWQSVTAALPVRMRSDSITSSSSVSTSSRPTRCSQSSQDSSSAGGGGGAILIQEGTSNVTFKSGGGGRGTPVKIPPAVEETMMPPPTTEDKRKALPRGCDQSMYESAIDNEEKLQMAVAIEEASKEEENQVGKNVLGRSDSLADVIDREDFYGDDDAAITSSSNPQWVWVTAGSCTIDPSCGAPAGWFRDNSDTISVSNLSLNGEPWRVDILRGLKANNESNGAFSKYNAAVERTSWVRKASAVVHGLTTASEATMRFEPCTVELEQTGSPQGGIDFGTLSVFGNARKGKGLKLGRPRLANVDQEHLSLFEITCVYQCGDKTLAVQTMSRSQSLRPLLIRFSADMEMEEWQADLVHGMNSVRGISGNGAPNFPGSLVSVTSRGEVMVFDPKVMSAEEESGSGDASVKKVEGKFMQDLQVKGQPVPVIRPLENGFTAGSLLSLTLRIPENAQGFSVNLQTGRPSSEADVALHFNPRLNTGQTVLNSRKSMQWDAVEEKQPLCVIQEDGNAFKAFNVGQTVQIVIKAEANYYQIIVNGTMYCRYNHRVKPEEVTHLRIVDDVEPKSVVYHSKSVIIPPSQMYWRALGGGHFLQAETSGCGVVWALGYDCRPWVYSGGWGGAHFKGSSSKFGINPAVEDTKYFYLYENQRWNPLTGFTTHGLPTDRYSWSDRSGKMAMSKETVKPPSIHWQWVSDWLIDYTTPGGVDSEGWQYATDFPSSYHGKSGFTDYVRRRRWARKCRTVTSGPWRQIGATKLVDLSMLTRPGTELVDLWAVASNGDALYREGVRSNCPEGSNWTPVSSDVPFQAVSVGGNKCGVWAIGKDGAAFLRHGVSEATPTGQFWLQVPQPHSFDSSSSGLRSVSVGCSSSSSALVWALDNANRLYLRQEVTTVFPEGTSWHYVTGDVRSISASGSELWAVLDSSSTLSSSSSFGGFGFPGVSVAATRGILARRAGVTPDNPAGTGWDVATGGGWRQVSIRGKHRQ